jgi:hypothetical protein
LEALEGDAACEEADTLLHGLGFRWRLARGLLAYPSPSLSSLPLPPPRSSQGKKTKAAAPAAAPAAAAAAALPSGALLHVVDDVLPPSLLEELRGAFLDPRAPFWREHG